jgi:hypothetical protein
VAQGCATAFSCAPLPPAHRSPPVSPVFPSETNREPFTKGGTIARCLPQSKANPGQRRSGCVIGSAKGGITGLESSD